MRKIYLQRDKIIILALTVIIIFQWAAIIHLKKPKKIAPAPLAVKGRIAIVLDDWGYNLDNLSILEEIKYPLTISILPNLSYSSAIAKEVHQRGFQIILHLPMEPHEKYRLEQQTILNSMDEGAIKGILQNDLINVPYVKGVSNHMGSSATENPRTMEIIFKELKSRNLYFLDSLVSPKSIAYASAKKTHLGFLKRDVFLDNIEKAEYIQGQVYRLKSKAQLRGWAIGIGHDRKTTLETLKKIMPELEKEGFKFVYVSELVR